MDDHKIAFIICTNDRVMLKECCMYIGLLQVPDGYTTDIITIEGAESMCAGYNAAMNDSDAKYKVYMHQDVFIVDSDFLSKLLANFRSDENIGMIGMVGAPRLDKNAIMWEMPRVGNLKTDKIDHMDFGFHPNEIIDVDCIDGLLMATQADVPWREDAFRSFHFYDVSQSFEFRRRGYRVVVQDVADDGIIHDDGVVNMFGWEPWRQTCIREYHDMLSPIDYRKEHGLETGVEFWKYLYENRESYQSVFNEAISFMDKAISSHDMVQYSLFLRMVSAQSDVCSRSGTIVKLYQMVQIVVNESNSHPDIQDYLSNVYSVKEALDKYQTCRQMIMRQILGLPSPYIYQADEYLDNISEIAERMIRKTVRTELHLDKNSVLG